MKSTQLEAPAQKKKMKKADMTTFVISIDDFLKENSTTGRAKFDSKIGITAPDVLEFRVR